MTTMRPDWADSRINYLAEEMYDHFLREASDYSNPDEWYEIAMSVADRFKERLQQSRERNMLRTPLLVLVARPD